MFCSVIYKYLSFFSCLLYNSICMIKYSLYSEKTFFPYHQYLKPFSISLECQSYQWSSELCLSKGGAVVRALASDHSGPGSNLGIDIIIMWVKFVVGSQLWSKRFIFRWPSFPINKTTIFKFQLDQEWQTKSQYIDVLLLNHYRLFIYLFIIIISLKNRQQVLCL